MASALFPHTTPSGAPADPTRPATAAAFGKFTIDLDRTLSYSAEPTTK